MSCTGLGSHGNSAEVYAHRSQLAALNGGDPDLQNLVPGTHFEALCATQHKDMFMLLLERSANPNSGTIQVSYCGDLEMLEALLDRSAEPNLWQRRCTVRGSGAAQRDHHPRRWTGAGDGVAQGDGVRCRRMRRRSAARRE